ncbi:MAG TPA: preprotein translocase subunit SecG [Rhodocyclaceae bacterium]|nr:preprotein translocase subunit SecG [Rhodocyclaceae bacterium]HMV53801.1 preprotein translocase subunit SecG [Rhodocyclaceae bacterium]HMZ84133.1 preprotein translocase subunit SecG [Rhodocyclaceae bacterium]HNA02269.1 preprotein translocase subunit SecG [Rhodocyclaceae bacterium]HNB78313.1 preprotein translocase subunit SecG [Rhodocyclaceae bacterium]
MEFLFPLVLTIHVLAGLGIVGLVLMQHGKGADMGAAFGSGASGSLFGATGSANFLSRTTAVLAGVFFVTSLALSYLATSRPKAGGSVMDNVPAQTAPAPKAPDAPAVPAPSGDAPNAPAGSKAQDIPK